MDQKLQIAVQEWLDFDPNPTTRAEIEQLVTSNNVAELQKRLGQRIAFGTAGKHLYVIFLTLHQPKIDTLDTNVVIVKQTQKL
jgi:hypothetical protein